MLNALYNPKLPKRQDRKENVMLRKTLVTGGNRRAGGGGGNAGSVSEGYRTVTFESGKESVK